MLSATDNTGNPLRGDALVSAFVAWWRADFALADEYLWRAYLAHISGDMAQAEYLRGRAEAIYQRLEDLLS
jgi:hypothetical protein